MLDECDAHLPGFMSEAQSMTVDLMALDIQPNQKMGIAVILATHFVGTAAALMAKISERKGGPILDPAGWSEEIMKMVLGRVKADRH